MKHSDLVIVGRTEEARQVGENGARAFRIDQLAPDRRIGQLASRGLPETPPEALRVEEWLRWKREGNDEPRLQTLKRLLKKGPTFREPLPRRS